MDKTQIWEVLQTCLLATDGADAEYLIKNGFDPDLARVGFQLYLYLHSRQLKGGILRYE